MNEQLTLWNIVPQDKSRCLNCFYECKSNCSNWKSPYEDKHIPLNGCKYYDGVSGGIPPIEELRTMYG